MDKNEILNELRSREGLTAFDIEVVQQLMQLRQLSDGESCNNSSQGSNGSSWVVKDQSKGRNHQGRSKAKATRKKGTEAVHDRDESLLPQKKRKYRSIVEIYGETKPVDAGEDE